MNRATASIKRIQSQISNWLLPTSNQPCALPSPQSARPLITHISALPDGRRLHSPYEPPYPHHPLGPENLHFNLQATQQRKTLVQPADLKTLRPPLQQSKQGRPKFATISNTSLLTSPHLPNHPHRSPFKPLRTSTSEISMSMGAIGLYISMITLWQGCTMIYGCRSVRRAQSVGPSCMGYREIAIAGG